MKRWQARFGAVLVGAALVAAVSGWLGAPLWAEPSARGVGQAQPVATPVQWSTPMPTPTPVVALNTRVGLELPAQVKVGEAFDAHVVVESDLQIRGAQCALQFDPTAVQVNGVSEGSFFKEWAKSNGGSTLVFPQAKVDNAQGRVSDIGVSIMGGANGGPVGKGVVCTYHLTAKEALGQSQLALPNVALTDERAQVLAGVQVNSSAVEVIKAGLNLGALLAGPWGVLGGGALVVALAIAAAALWPIRAHQPRSANRS